MLSLRRYSTTDNAYVLDRSKEVLELAITSMKDGTTKNIDAIVLLIALCIELNDFNRAELMLGTAFTIKLNGIDSVASLYAYDGDESLLYDGVDPIIYVMLCILRTKQGLSIDSRRALFLANKAIESDNTAQLGRPKRGAVVCLVKASLYCFDRGLIAVGTLCHSFATDCDIKTTEKAIGKNLPANSPDYIRHMLNKSLSFSLFHQNNGSGAIKAAEDSANVSQDLQLQADGWVCAAECIRYTLGANESVYALSMAFQSKCSISLYTYIALARQLLLSGQFEESLTVCLRGFKAYPLSSTLLLLIGINSFKLDRLLEAENALTEATLLNSHNCEVWLYLSLLCLSYGSLRLEEATRTMKQALRLNPNDISPVLLRELATSFMSVDCLEIAEELIRRSMSRGNSMIYSRKILAGKKYALH